MECRICYLNSICKHYDNINKMSHETNAELDVRACKFFNKETGSHIDHSLEREVPIPIRTDYPDLNQNKQDSKLELSVITSCPSCKGRTYNTDIKECADCGKIICPGCGTETMTGELYCNDCWEKR